MAGRDVPARILRFPTSARSERQRQVAVEGFTPEGDDGYAFGELAAAATCYAWIASASDEDRAFYVPGKQPVEGWPWSAEWWKPSTRERDLDKAGALWIAELDRAGRVITGLGDPV